MTTSAINLTANRKEFQRYLTHMELLAPRFPDRSLYRRPWYRRWLDAAIRGFLVWYTVVVAGLAIVLMNGC